jgi:hypothetical protein
MPEGAYAFLKLTCMPLGVQCWYGISYFYNTVCPPGKGIFHFSLLVFHYSPFTVYRLPFTFISSLLLTPKSPRPILPVQTPVINSLRQVVRLDICTFFEISNCPGHFQDAVIRAGGQAEFFHSGF